jgi:transcriptional regulator
MTGSNLELMKGTLDVLILRTLRGEEMHGYSVSRSIHERTRGVLSVEDAALYQALHRLERRGSLTARWGVSENNRRAKFYRLTALGRQQLEADADTWRTYVEAVARVLDPDAAPGGAS